jgi:hypothetical protein
VSARDTERLELERAGWERLEHEGETVWRNPVSGLVYPQGIAISILREGETRMFPLGQREGRDGTLPQDCFTKDRRGTEPEPGRHAPPQARLRVI